MGDAKVNVESFVRFIVQLGGIYDVDDDGYVVIDRNEGNPLQLKIGGKYRHLMVMKDEITDNDALIINPLNENITEADDAKWVYTQLSCGLARRLLVVAKHLNFIISSEKTESGSEILSTDELTFAARHKDFNQKAYEAIEAVGKKMLGFSHVYYDRKRKNAALHCSIYNPDTIAEFPQFSQKAWKAATALMGDLLGLSKESDKAIIELREKYVVGSELINIPKLESVLTVYYRIYCRLNQFLMLCGSEDEYFEIDLTEFGYHLEHLQDYYNKAKYFVGTSTLGLSKPEKPKYNLPLGTPVFGGGNNIRQVEETNIPPNPLLGNTDLMQYHIQRPQQPMFGGGFGGNPIGGGGFGMGSVFQQPIFNQMPTGNVYF